MKTLAVFARALVTVALIAALSALSVRLWGEKPETAATPSEILVSPDMSMAAFGDANRLPAATLKEVFGLRAQADLQRPISEFGMDTDTIARKARKALALEHEEATKNWVKIPLKFSLWFAFLATALALMLRNRINAGNRKWLYLGAAAVFGVGLGADPSPMGTVKDAIALFGAQGVIFPPRLIALVVFLLTVVVANKFICSWGCQFGAVQDLLFRLNRNPFDRKGIVRQFRIPFAVANTVRVLFVAAFTAIALGWAVDIIAPIDPFKLFKPAVLGIVGGGFLVLVLAASLFVYRPWCHFFCPFGLIGWVVEKASLARISVDYSRCNACTSWVSACPSDAMEAILKQDRVVPDCFSCNTCVEACPSEAISFRFAKRQKPPPGHFSGRSKEV